MLMCEAALDFFVRLLCYLPLPGYISQKFKHVVGAIVAQNRNGEIFPIIQLQILIGVHKSNCEYFAFGDICKEDTGCFFGPDTTVEKVVIVLVN